jgi:SPP1 gp7 family putative phage head morphogenesis protein
MLLTPAEMRAQKKLFADLAKDASSAQERKYLLDLSRRVRLSREDALMAEMQHWVTELAYTVDDQINPGLQQIYTDKELYNLYNLEQGLGLKFVFERRSPAQIGALIRNGFDDRNYSGKIWHDRDTLVHNLRNLVPRMFIEGASQERLSRELVKLSNTSYNNTIRIIRTEASHVAAQADIWLYSQTDIEEYVYVAILDSVTSEICQALDGLTFKVSQARTGINLPPMHPNCRSTTSVDIDMSDYDQWRLVKENVEYVRIPESNYEDWKESRGFSDVR